MLGIRVKKILSIDGGGIRGIYPAYILQCIEERLDINLFDTFDLIAGTSTGSIIAAGVATGLPASEIVEMYKKHGAKIFQKKRPCLPNRLSQIFFDSIYDSKNLDNALTDVFKDTRMSDIKKPLILPCTDISNGGVHVIKSIYSEEFTRDNEVLVKDAVLASCSAPTYFNPHKLGENLLSDGALWANNPALAAVIDAKRRLKVKFEDIQVLSIGTGSSKIEYGTNPFRKWGFMNGWKRSKFIDLVLSLQSQSAMNYLGLMLQPEQIKRIDLDSDIPLSLDDVSQICPLISKADKKFTDESAKINTFINS